MGWFLLASQWDSLAAIIDTESFIAHATDFFGHNDMDMVSYFGVNLVVS